MSSNNKQLKNQALTTRPPVIVVMGHIDHGKSTLLDYIRQTKVADSEVGGITQAVSAYEVEKKRDDGQSARVTFIDTPGHEAFSQMRKHGARLADIAILIVSAEEGVKPQTIEALKTIQAQNLSYIVAINKIDRPNANVEMVKQQLAEQEVMVEGYGGTIPWVAISAKTGQGVDELLELLLLTADLAELKGDRNLPATGLVLEAQLDPKSGNTAVLIIKDGTLRQGDYLVIGQTASKIKALKTFRGEAVTELSFSSPALLVGLASLPSTGANFQTYAERKLAEQAAKEGVETKTAQAGTVKSPADETKLIVPLIIKTDVVGSVAAVEHELAKLNTAGVELKVVSTGIGPVSENDVKLATASDHSIVLGFNIKATKSALELADHQQVQIKTFDIIYKLAEWLAEEIKRRTPTKQVEVVAGEAKILKIFSVNKNKQVVGGTVQNGTLKAGKKIKILRRGTEIGQGELDELQQQKLKAKEVEAGSQFGSLVISRTIIAPGDLLVSYDIVNQ